MGMVNTRSVACKLNNYAMQAIYFAVVLNIYFTFTLTAPLEDEQAS